MALPRFVPLTWRLVIEVGLPSLVASLLVTGVVYLIRLPSPAPAQASEVAAPAPEGLRATGGSTTSEAPPSSATPGARATDATRGRYRLRVGVFSILSNAMVLAEDLKVAGYSPEVVPRRNSRDQELYFLYAASYDDSAEAESAAEELRQRGQEVFIEEGEPTTG